MNSPMMTMNTTALIDFNSFIKKMLALCLAVVMTMTLFYMMYLLIKNDGLSEEPPKTPDIPSVNYKAPDIKPLPPEEKPLIKPVIQVPPPSTYVPVAPTVETPVEIPTIPVIEPTKNISFTMNTQPLPMVKVSPEYPSQATIKGTEGFVDVVFDVTETGATENIQIVYAEPAKIFNSAVLKAVARWKYKPKMEEGVPMKMYGLRERIRFNMEK